MINVIKQEIMANPDNIPKKKYDKLLGLANRMKERRLEINLVISLIMQLLF